MKTYSFELALASPTTEGEDERLFERFEGRTSSAVVNGEPLLYVHLSAISIDHAVAEALRGVRETELQVKRIELDPEDSEEV